MSRALHSSAGTPCGMKETLHRLHMTIRALSVALVVTLIVIIAYFSAPAFNRSRDIIYENPAHPVLPVRDAEGHIWISNLVLDKLPPPCEWKSWRWMGAGPDGVYESVPVERPGWNPKDAAPRPSGLQSFGAIRTVQPAPRNWVTLKAIWWYRCGTSVVETHDELGPWKIQ